MTTGILRAYLDTMNTAIRHVPASTWKETELATSKDFTKDEELEAVKASKPTRTFTKKVLVFNIFLAWLFASYAVYSGLDDVAIACLGLITMLFGLYTGVGHLDYRKVLEKYK